MFGPLGLTELGIIVAIVALLFGAKRLPQLGRSLGDGIREFRKAGSNLIGDDNGGHDD